MEFKPCPFCGATEPTVHLIDAPESAVVCDYKMGGCGADAGLFNTDGRAIEAWNTRADPEFGAVAMTEENMAEHGWVRERTCHVFEDGNENYRAYRCDACLKQAVSWGSYCPSCGAKVVE